MLSSVPLGVLLSGGSVIDLDGTLFIQLGIFFVAFLILKTLVFGPVMKLFDEREAAIGGARAQAEEMQTGARDKRDHFEGELRKVRQAATVAREKLRADGRVLARELTEKARAQSVETLAAAKTRLEGEAALARQKARAEVPALARQIAEKLLDRSVN